MLPWDPLTGLPDASVSTTSHDDAYVDIWWWPHRRGMDWSKISSVLSPDEQTRAATFALEKDAFAFMAGRYLQRSVLSAYTDIPAADLDIAAGPYGKPYLANAGITFNLSNTEGLAVFAISRHCMMLGIDAEPMATAIEPETSSLFCSSAEVELLSTLHGNERRALLLNYWTLKESLLKAVGTGLITAPDQLNIRLDRSTDTVLIDDVLTDDDTCWHHRLLHAPSSHLIAVSAQTDQADLTLRQREMPDPK
jgi:4'-phosphopantetheinyl transferase